MKQYELVKLLICRNVSVFFLMSFGLIFSVFFAKSIFFKTFYSIAYSSWPTRGIVKIVSMTYAQTKVEQSDRKNFEKIWPTIFLPKTPKIVSIYVNLCSFAFESTSARAYTIWRNKKCY